MLSDKENGFRKEQSIIDCEFTIRVQQTEERTFNSGRNMLFFDYEKAHLTHSKLLWELLKNKRRNRR
jgi:hypothetical protein